MPRFVPSALAAALCVGLASCAASGPARDTAPPPAAASSSSAEAPATVNTAAAACPTTPPPRPPFVPPPPYPATPSPGSGGGRVWYGSAELWTWLDPSGTWELARDENGLFDKSFWWRAGFDPLREPTPDLSLTARRLDAPTQEIAASHGPATNGWTDNSDMGAFMLTGIHLPTPGCWQITGHYGTNHLTFVVRVT